MIQKIHLHFMKELQYQKQEEEGMMEIIDTFEKSEYFSSIFGWIYKNEN